MPSRPWEDKAAAAIGHAWRAHMFAPVSESEAINRKLNRGWNDAGDDLSVPLSAIGTSPATHRAGSGVVTGPMLQALEAALQGHEGACALVVESGGYDVLAVLGDAPAGLQGQRGDFWDLATRLGLSRVDAAGGAQMLAQDSLPSSLLLQSIVTLGAEVPEGRLIEAVAPAWLAIASEIERDVGFLANFARNPRAFEEFLAGAYERDGYQVIVTPRSGDGGRDVIATKSGFGSIRILEQAKAYSPGHLVTHDDVRAMLGVLHVDRGASKGIVTTTSDFQPGILTGESSSHSCRTGLN